MNDSMYLYMHIYMQEADGKITIEDFTDTDKHGKRTEAHKLKQEFWRLLVDAVDEDGSGSIELDEFSW